MVALTNLEPWGEERADLRSALAAASIMNTWITEPPYAKVEDLMVSSLIEKTNDDAERKKEVAAKMKYAIQALSANLRRQNGDNR